MIKTLVKEDLKLIIDLYRNINRFDEIKIRDLEMKINDTKILTAIIENNKIILLLEINLIKNNYYLEDIVILDNDIEKINQLLAYTVNELKSDERGLNIIYDNFPFSTLMDKVMKENGFFCNFMNLKLDKELIKMELISKDILLNDKSDDVKEFIYENNLKEIKSSEKYLGKLNKLPEIESINLENTNVAVKRNKNNEVIGTARFGLVGDSIYLYSLYASGEQVYKELITLISNLTYHNIEVGFLPIRKDLEEILLNIGFKKYQTDYILKLY